MSARDVPTAARQLGAAALRVRGPLSMSRFLRSEVLAGQGIPHGDGRPVVLLPPAAAGDWLMPVMLNWLRRINYTSYRSSIGLHIDCSDRTMARIIPRLEQIADSNGRKVTLVGHSRGGLLARAIGAHRPDLIERVITLASPMNAPFSVTNLTLAAAASLARNRMQHRHPDVGCMTEACACPYGQAFRSDLAVPLISLFTKHDDVVRWESCVVEGARNIEVRGTHVGLLASRNVYTALAHALTGSCDSPGTDWCTAAAEG